MLEGDQPGIEVVRIIKDKAIPHRAVTDHGEIIGLLFVSNIL